MQNSRALVVAINSYRQVDSSGRWDLRGCIADAQDWVRWFKFKGVEEIKVLTDSEATSEGVLAACRWLQEGLWKREGNVMSPVLGGFRAFTFSGHGTIYKGRPALVPYDLTKTWSNALTYPRLGRVLTFPEGTAVTLLIDACHSGDRVRSAFGPNSNVFGKEHATERFLPPPMEHCRFGAQTWEEKSDRGIRTKVAPKPDSWYHISSPDIDVALTGCQKNQTSADAWINNAFHGPFTYSLMRILEETQGDISYAEMIKRSNAWMDAHGYAQNPQYMGPTEYQDLRFMAVPKVTVLDGKPDEQ